MSFWSLPRLIFVLILSIMFLKRAFSVFAKGLRRQQSSAIQRMYNELVKSTKTSSNLRESAEAAAFPAPHLRECMKAMEGVTLQDLGLSAAALSRVREAVCMTVVSSQDFDIAVFILPPGDIPLSIPSFLA